MPVSALMLQLKAQSVAKDIGIADGQFRGAWAWQKGFLARHGLSFRARTRQGQQHPEDMDGAAMNFWQKVAALRAELGVAHIYNADQTGICFEYIPKHTVSSRGAATVWVRCGDKDKERFTAMFLARSDGFQYDPFFVMKSLPSKIEDVAQTNTRHRHGFGKVVWKEIAPLETKLSVVIFGNRCAWWDSTLSMQFLDYHFANRDKDQLILLLWDDFSAHWTDKVEDYALMLNVYLLRVPPGLTGVCQPADVSWFRPLKSKLRSRWVDFLIEQLQNHQRANSGGAFRLVPPSRVEAIEWATEAWRSLGVSVIMSGFKHGQFDNRRGGLIRKTSAFWQPTSTPR